MPVQKLYASAFPDDVLESSDPSARRRQSRQGQLSQSVGSVRTIAAEPGQRVLRGSFTGTHSDVMASELQELLQASDDIDAVPYFPKAQNQSWQGYYAPAEQRKGDRRDPPLPNVHTFAGVLTPKGTRESHVRTVRVTPQDVTNPFGTGQTEAVFIAANATRPRWVNEKRNQIEAATEKATHFTEYGENVSEFNATEPTFAASNESYDLVYDIPYDVEWQTDPRVWDDYDRARNQTVNNVTVDPSWPRVYTSQHSYVGNRTIDTGRLRVEPAPAQNAFTAKTWNATSGAYETVSLGASDWELLDWDIRRIGLERVESLTTWQNASDTTSTAELTADVRRGYDDIHFYRTPNSATATPADLVTLLDPVANESDRALAEQASLIDRRELPDE